MKIVSKGHRYIVRVTQVSKKFKGFKNFQEFSKIGHPLFENWPYVNVCFKLSSLAEKSFFFEFWKERMK